jgi:hypothetical protein
MGMSHLSMVIGCKMIAMYVMLLGWPREAGAAEASTKLLQDTKHGRRSPRLLDWHGHPGPSLKTCKATCKVCEINS